MKNRTRLVAGIAALILAAGPVTPQQNPIGKGDPILYSHYKGLEAFGVTQAWRLGITGRGVKVAVIDDGIDFGTPDLYGAQARVETKGSPYQGWPIVIDLMALKDYQQSGKPAGHTGYIDTSSMSTEGLKVTGTSRSGVYHVGSHTDRFLRGLHNEAIKVLVVDEKDSGVYDTVYMDLNNNKDFTDDKACRRGDETAVLDRDGDGLSDVTGGMVYFVADGVNPPPPGRLLYGKEAKVPAAGELVALHFVMSGHGTMCAGTIAARGRNVRGIAPEASLIAVLGWSGNEMELCLLTALGYDGLPGTGDEANVISRSAGFDLFNKGADEITAFLEYLTTTIAPATTLVYASGNEGSGYATCSAPSADHVITAGAIEDLWWRLSSQRGDVVAFSSRGPNVLGKVKPNVLGNGEWAPRVRPILTTNNGRTAWDKDGGGTSNATPHVAAITALIYQAYKTAHGEFPTSALARDILMSSADDINEEVFAQGAGTINARRAAELAMGTAKDGALIRPALLVTDPVEAGKPLEFKMRISQDPAKPMTMAPVKLIKTGERRFGIGAAGDTRLYPVDKGMLGGDLLKVSSIFAMDPALKDLESATGYWVFLYKWTDKNRDGRYADSPDATPDQAQKGELEILSGSTWDHIITAETRLHDPATRSGDGLLIGLEKNGKIKSRDATIILESYSWKPWEGATLTRSGDEITLRLTAPAETGISQGKILVSTKGAATRQCVPVSFATYLNDTIKASPTSEPYELLRLYGRLEGSGRFGYRDARFFPFFHKGEELASVSVQWETTGSDFDLVLYGPGTVDTSKMWSYPVKPPVDLP
ncbi:MAG: putative peptidase, partial [Candidatus Aminicenantes bacterium]|nr:putative peptidase [Candidatus Aminicenantes bacterium]